MTPALSDTSWADLTEWLSLRLLLATETPDDVSMWTRLAGRLHAEGADLVVPGTAPDPLLPAMLSRGESVNPGRIVLRDGEANRCHWNAARWLRSGLCSHIGTGFALIPGVIVDGVPLAGFVRHSWGINDGTLIDSQGTTAVAYWGITLDDDELVDFLKHLGVVSHA